MTRNNPVSPGTTGFVTTLVLTCAFAIIASAIWQPRESGGTSLAAEASQALVTPAIAR